MVILLCFLLLLADHKRENCEKKKKRCVHRDRQTILLYTIHCSTHCGACSDCRIGSSHTFTIKELHKESKTPPLYYRMQVCYCMIVCNKNVQSNKYLLPSLRCYLQVIFTSFLNYLITYLLHCHVHHNIWGCLLIIMYLFFLLVCLIFCCFFTKLIYI